MLRSPCAHMPPPIPRWNRRVRVSLSSPPIAAFPVSKAGRLPHQHFQGLLSVHYSLQPVSSRGHLRDPFHRRLQPFRHLHDCSDCYRLERKLPGGSVSHWVIAPFHGARRVEERRGCLGHAATLRFLSPLIEPDMGAPIRLSDKTSGVRSRKAMSRRLQFDEPQGLVEVLVRKACSPCAAFGEPDRAKEVDRRG